MLDHSPNFSGAKIAIFVGDKLLVIRRDDKPDIPYPAYWDLMGGGREGAETPLQCALRETQEEVGLTILPREVVWSVRYERPRGEVWFFATHQPASVEANIQFGDEGQEWRLWDPNIYCAHPKAVPHFVERLQE